MNRKGLVRLMALAILVVMGLTIAGCVTEPVFTNVRFPDDGGKYVILGRVSIDVNLWHKGGGFDALMAAAKEKYPKADDVVNIFIDRTGIPFYFPLKGKISGVAIDYVEVK